MAKVRALEVAVHPERAVYYTPTPKADINKADTGIPMDWEGSKAAMKAFTNKGKHG